MARSGLWLVAGMVLGMMVALPPSLPSTSSGGEATATEFSLWSVHTPAATETPSRTPTLTPEPTETPVPTETPTLTPTSTPTLTPFLIVMENGQYGPVVVTAPAGYVLPTKTATAFVGMMPQPLPADVVVLPAAVVVAAPEPTATTAPQRVQPVVSVSDCGCEGDSLNCDNFSSQEDAQACYQQCMNTVYKDIHGLDGNDADGLACESLP